jgi:predicted amidohydrolase YtcJ
MSTTYVNGKIFTGRSEDDFVTSFTVAEGRFTDVGGSPTGEGDVVDLGGATVLPGLLDVHTHPSYIAMTAGAVACTPPGVTSVEELVAALRRADTFGAGPDVWIEGWGYDESRLAEGRSPTAEDLDRVSATQPVYVLRSDCHSGVCNSRGLELAGITAESSDPEGGELGRHPDGRPNGVLREHGANDLVLRAKAVPDFDAEVARLAAVGGHLAERGIVAAAEMMALPAPLDHLELFRAAEPKGLVQRINLFYVWTELKAQGAPDLTEDQRTGRIKVAGVKLFMDGSISNRTAWMLEPFPDSDSHGMNTLADSELWAAFDYARRNRVQLAVHVMGDRGVQHLIDTLGDQEPWMGDLPSVRLEHATMLTEEQIAGMNAARMTFGVASQVIFFFAEQDSYAANLSASQYGRAYATRSCYDGLAAFGLSSDRPATTWDDPDDVFVSVKAAVTRRAHNGADIGAGQALTVAQALLLYTSRPARVADYEGAVGTVAAGKEASFVVLDRDVFAVPVEEIDRVRVTATYVGGRQVFATSAPSST